MNTLLTIRCRDLGVDHDGFVSGSSLEDLIDCVTRTLSEETGTSIDRLSAPDTKALIRSALVQTCRPAAARSIDLLSLVA